MVPSAQNEEAIEIGISSLVVSWSGSLVVFGYTTDDSSLRTPDFIL